MLQNVLRMIRDANGVPLAAVIRKRIIPRPDSDGIAFGLQHSEYVSRDDEELTRETISLYAKNSRKNTPQSDIVSTRFILDLEKSTFKMTHIKHRISRAINLAYIGITWCCSMNDQFDLE